MSNRWFASSLLALELTLGIALALTVARLVVEAAYGPAFAGALLRLEELSLAKAWPAGPWDVDVVAFPGDGPAVIAVTMVMASYLLRMWRTTPVESAVGRDAPDETVSQAAGQAIVLGALFLGQTKAIALTDWAFSDKASPVSAERWMEVLLPMLVLSGVVLALQRGRGRRRAFIKVALTNLMTAAIAAAAVVIAQTVAPLVVSGIRYEAYISGYLAIAVLVSLAVATALRLDRHRHRLLVRGLQSQVAEARLQQQAAERGRELAALQLTTIRSQVEPHFLWNTIGSLDYMVRKQHQDAAQMSRDLLNFLQHCRPQARGVMSTVAAEMKALSAYTGLMRVRLGGRLSIAFEIDPLTTDTPIPSLVLQTLAENAMQHGLEPKVGPVKLMVRSRLDGDAVTVEVEDTGVGLLTTPKRPGSGIGLRSVRAALHEAFGEAGRLTLTSNDFGGVTALVKMPAAEMTV